jgi:rhodanese-related sulfurtransferase
VLTLRKIYLMKMIIKCMLSAYMLVLFGACQAQTKNDLNAKAFEQKIAESKDAVILDVREQDEANVMGQIKNSTRIDYYQNDFEAQLTKLDPKKTYFVYCAGGVRSSKACKLLASKGFKNVYNLIGGFSAWENAKLPVEMLKTN